MRSLFQLSFFLVFFVISCGKQEKSVIQNPEGSLQDTEISYDQQSRTLNVVGSNGTLLLFVKSTSRGVIELSNNPEAPPYIRGEVTHLKIDHEGAIDIGPIEIDGSLTVRSGGDLTLSGAITTGGDVGIFSK